MAKEGIVLIDSSSWIEALRRSGRVDIRNRVRQLMLDGRAAWNEMVALELWNGASGQQEKAILKGLTEDIIMLSTGPEVWMLANELARACRHAGHMVPAADLLIVAGARHHRVQIEHCDTHFNVIEKVARTLPSSIH